MRRDRSKLMSGNCRKSNSGIAHRQEKAIEALLAKEAKHAAHPLSAENRQAPSVYTVIKPKRRKKDGDQVS